LILADEMVHLSILPTENSGEILTE
jgi:hypothetical protein